VLDGSSELKANECESTSCIDNDREAAISAHIGRSVLRSHPDHDYPEMEEEEVEEEEEDEEEEEEEDVDSCRSRMGETWDACARTNGSDRCGAETTRHHTDNIEQIQIRLSLRAMLVMLPVELHTPSRSSTTTHSTPAVSAILKLRSIHLGTAEEAAE
jgi:hypothetical protein